MIQLLSAATPGYPWTEPFRASLDRHFDIPWRILETGKDIPLPGTRGQMLQHGAFLEHLPEYKIEFHHDRLPQWDMVDPVILFVDADMICQRRLMPAEVMLLNSLTERDICVGLNGPRGETLAQEATQIGQQVDDWVVDQLFPGWRELPAWNTGFVAARRSAYQRLYDQCRALMPAAEWCFSHYAAVQWLMCYCLGRWLHHVELPQTIHLHGCWGAPAGLGWTATGEATLDGELVAFRHAINLEPDKCVRWPGKTANAKLTHSRDNP